MAGWLRALREGHVTFERFYTGTYRDWERMGGRLMSRWQVPQGVELQDVIQELMIGAWICLPKYEPGRASLVRFCVYNAMDRAKRWMHQQRNALRRSDRNPGRYPSTGWDRGDGSKRPLEDLLHDPAPRPDEAVELNRLSRMLRQQLEADVLVAQLVEQFEGLDPQVATQIVQESRNPRGRSQS